MDGTYNNFSVTTSSIQPNNLQQFYTDWSNLPTDTNMVISQPQIQSKCKCPNPKHTQGCSIEPTGEYCEWCSKGCRKRVMAVHVRYEE